MEKSSLVSLNFRQYDPQIGRFMGVDPLADYYGQDRYSPYAAMGNQPESMIDPNGLKNESTYQGVHHYSTYFVDDGGYYKKSYGEKTMMDMRIEGIEGHIFNFIGSLGGASFSSEMQTQINNNAFWNYMMNIYLKSEGNFSLKAENNMLRLSFQTSWSENRVVVIQLNTFYIDLSSFGKSDYNNNLQQNGGNDKGGFWKNNWHDVAFMTNDLAQAVGNNSSLNSALRMGRPTTMLYVPPGVSIPVSTKVMSIVSKVGTPIAKAAPWLAGFAIGTDIYNNQSISWGNVYQGTVLGLSLIPGAGLNVGGLSLIAEGVSYYYTGQSISENINQRTNVIYNFK